MNRVPSQVVLEPMLTATPARRPSPAPWTRRRFLAASGLGVLAPIAILGAGGDAADDDAFASFDRTVTEFMRARQIPGGSLAVVKDRRLVYVKGYGWADRDKQVPVRPDTLFRIASISKPFTAAAVLKLVERQHVQLEDKAFATAGLLPPENDPRLRDERIARITVRQLLQHTAGWDRDRSGDPMFQWKKIARELKLTGPPEPRGIIRYMTGRKLDFEPGARYAYSNLGYCVLGRLIEKLSGKAYSDFVRESLLGPAGIMRMRLGKTLEAAPNETRYYTAKDERGESLFPGTPGQVAEPYGTFSIEVMDAHGGWLATAADLVRFAAMLDDPRSSPLLQPATLDQMNAPPPPPAWRAKNGNLEPAYYGCGWMVRPVGHEGRANYWHSGSLPGTSSLLVRRWDGLDWAVVFNQRSGDDKLPDGAIDGALHQAAAAVSRWPTHDLFPANL
jgi:CubicO group peptidase (beta-lactamase class C family)